MTKVGMLYICTGKYTVFWPEFYRTFNDKFLPNCEKEYFVFTDAPAIEYEDAPGVHRHLSGTLPLALQHPQAVLHLFDTGDCAVQNGLPLFL